MLITQFKKGLPVPHKAALLATEFTSFTDLICAAKTIADYFVDSEFIYIGDNSEEGVRALLLDEGKDKSMNIRKTAKSYQDGSVCESKCCHSGNRQSQSFDPPQVKNSYSLPV